ncbi:MAG: uroporphyrinogen-III synthase [Noviherbaspirillum sp.]
MPDTIVVTRPLAQAGALAGRIAALGHAAEVFPLLEIHPLPDQEPLKAALADVGRYAMVAFVSPNAIDAAFAARPDWPTGDSAPALAVVGEGSRAALARHGLTDANARIHRPRDPGRSDSEALLEVLDTASLRGKPVLIVRGESGRELLADALRAAGAQVTALPAYRRAAPVLDGARSARLATLLEADSAWIVTSSEALHNLVEMAHALAGAAGVAKIQNKRLVVPHRRIADTARQLGFHHIRLTGSGDDALLAALPF